MPARGRLARCRKGPPRPLSEAPGSSYLQDAAAEKDAASKGALV